MLTDSIMYECIEMLLADKTDEESLECLCKLLRTIGKEMDGKVVRSSSKIIWMKRLFLFQSPANRKTLEKHYDELNKIIAEQKVSARIRFMIQDLMEERKVRENESCCFSDFILNDVIRFFFSGWMESSSC